jgi:hypothetical protein
VERETPTPGAGEVLLEMLAAPINPSDVLTITGQYGALPPLPAVGGNEGVARVAQRGADVQWPAVGDLVLMPVGAGSWSTHAVAKADSLLPLPAGGDPLQRLAHQRPPRPGKAAPARQRLHQPRSRLRVDPVGLQHMMALPSVVTMEKYGSSATVVTGELARYQGIPVLTSEYMRSDVNATGVYDGTTMNRSGILLVNTRRFYVGMRRPIRVKIMEDLPNQDRWLLASYQRKDFQGFVQSATETSVSYGYNVAV